MGKPQSLMNFVHPETMKMGLSARFFSRQDAKVPRRQESIPAEGGVCVLGGFARALLLAAYCLFSGQRAQRDAEREQR